MGPARGTCRVMCFHPKSNVTIALMDVEDVLRVIKHKFIIVLITVKKKLCTRNSNGRPENSTLPLHVRKFVAEYSWLKVMSMSVDSLKKSPETIPEAVTILKTLIDDKLYSQSSRGKWYSELALIEMHHLKNLENSAALAIHALQQNTLTEVDVSDLVERLRKLTRRKTGLSKETRELVEKTLLDVEEKGLVPQPANTKIIKANMANRYNSTNNFPRIIQSYKLNELIYRAESTGKSTWSITINGRDKFYGSVEVLALQHYTSEEMFVEGLHCEGHYQLHYSQYFSGMSYTLITYREHFFRITNQRHWICSLKNFSKIERKQSKKN
ncbi:unnamed protein product [Trichogramma brassicae]|uniref:Fanconi-associated nuclease n=1 Tax=Trichogramma brassicae TaxID=86971 RepID=A0A6H5I5M5_9HYME|nr:unnamed protein product [Trichogramma brassicae]